MRERPARSLSRRRCRRVKCALACASKRSPNLRRDSMHPHKHRQYRLPFCALFFAAAHSLLAENARDTPAAQELAAVRAQVAALAVHDASAEDWAKVVRTFAEFAARHPRDAAVRGAHAEFLWERDDRERAIAEWEAAERLAPRDAVVLSRLADAHLAMGRGKECAQYFQKACDAAPGSARLRHAAGNAIFLFRHELVDEITSEDDVFARALAHLAAAARLAPEDVEYARAYAETFYALPKPDWREALAAWEHYLAVSPSPDFAHVNLARIRLKRGQLDAARRALEKIQGAGFERLKGKLREQIETAASRPIRP